MSAHVTGLPRVNPVGTLMNSDVDLARISEELRELAQALGDAGAGTDDLARLSRARNEVLITRRLVRARLAEMEVLAEGQPVEGSPVEAGPA